MNRYIVGLTGGIGSGKTTVANRFAELGVPLIDADIVARQVVKPGSKGLTEITRNFGDDILLDDGQLDRAALREVVFHDPDAKQWLNELLHPLIRQTMLQQTENAKSEYVIWVVPLLFENGLDRFTNRCLVVDIPESLQLQRTLERDNSSPETIKNIISSQINRQFRLEKADDVIDNRGEPAAIREQVIKLHQTYLALSKGSPN